MLLARIAEVSSEVAATRSRNRKRDLMAELLREAPVEDIEIAATYLSGSLRQRRTGLGWASLASAPDPAPESSLTLAEVDQAFEEIAALAGAGSAAARTSAAAALFGAATAAEQKLLLGLVFEELRQGALDAVVQEALAKAFEAPVATVRRAAMLLGSTPRAAALLAAEGDAALEAVGLTVGVPVQPMLAASAPDPQAAAAKSGLPVIADYKLDGIRVQVHRRGSEVNIYTRSLDDITARLPDLVRLVQTLPADQLVLDGEALAFRPDGRPEIFQVIAARTASQAVEDQQAQDQQSPLSIFFFDVLHVDGRDFLDEPFTVRAEALAAVAPGSMIVPRHQVDDVDTLTEIFHDAVGQGYEGVVIKNPAAPYAAGRRDSGWIKIKPRHTFDVVVIAAEWGHGRREGWLSNLHLAAPDEQTGELVMLGKTFKGLTDALLTWQTEKFLELETRRTPGTVHVEPTLVVEIACDGIQRSTRYPGGIALRFARVLRYRPDKSAEEADTLQTIRRLGPIVDPAGD